ncbi:relaxase/mobilization nuclease domain-containing protein [Tissierella sp. P1]|uniref:relaxase/mobilization nuclease domain-containing protein n=1 Tax=Tissierella sp. P1 TaxID=1280483 RepID=UPI001303AAE2|nr:relaxase/mobilization nuclease domain-containing protein [Tissierella sp. P1]
MNRTKDIESENIQSLFEEALILSGLVTGINCCPDSAFNEMMVIKNMYNKIGGREFIHFIHSFHPKENITSELAHEISLKLLEYKKFKDFQILAITHTDKQHIHTHFILNTVNIEDGRKWNLSINELIRLKQYSNYLCELYNLKYSHVIPKKQ